MDFQGRVKFQVWLMILAVFLLGGVTGASLDRLYLTKSETGRFGPGGPASSGRHGRPPMIEAMKKDLNLSDEQVTQIRNIFEETRKEFHPSRFAECPGMKEMREKTRSRVRAALTPEQQQKYDQFINQREAEMDKK